MPSASKKSAKSHSVLDNFPFSADLESGAPDPEVEIRSTKKKGRNGVIKQVPSKIDSPEHAQPAEVALEEGDSPPVRPQSLLDQIPHAFSDVRKSKPVDISSGITTTEKVSDQYTPPSDNWLQDEPYEKTPPIESVAALSPASTPPIEPGFSTRGGFHVRSPPISPPQRHVRPVSFSAAIPPLPHHSRSSTSPYAYQASSYGSPPAPHLPQKHFYGAQDLNLGFAGQAVHQATEPAKLTKFITLPPAAGERCQGLLLGYDSHLTIHAYDGNKMEELGSLSGLPGSVIDAIFLTWTSGPDPFSELRPLVAVTIHAGYHENGQPNPAEYPNGPGMLYHSIVEIYSLSKQTRVAELLRTPSISDQPSFRGGPAKTPSPTGDLKLNTAGNYMTISSGASGEVFVFTQSQESDSAVFCCIAKFWTAIQPQAHRRDSSHSRPVDLDASPADLNREITGSRVPLVDLSGRWLAICPSGNASQPSLNATLGAEVLISRHANLEITMAPPRPSINCEVVSPDVDTLFAKVARGVAQEMVKGARWLGDQGVQVWQSYWKKDTSPSNSVPRQSYSSPQYPTTQNFNQFPPTHAEMALTTNEPDLVSIYDLRILTEMSSRKGSAILDPMVTFHPPKGCSFLSFAPQGLSILTASRKGDFQYVWDLLQILHPKTTISSIERDNRSLPKVRQTARFERLSGSTIVDVVWESPAGARFAILTKNKTIHLFDLPQTAFKWPPPRQPKKSRPVSSSANGDLTPSGEAAAPAGFLASAMNMAGKTQPIISNWRGRAPSVGGSLAGIGTTSIGIASATGVRGGRAVAAGLSKSLGAASETVSHIRHAGESRLHMKSNHEAEAGRICWGNRSHKPGLCTMDEVAVKFYHIRRSVLRDKRSGDGASVFDARRAVSLKVPKGNHVSYDDTEPAQLVAHWVVRSKTLTISQSTQHPLSFAEIETNAPYQPFHSDRRVSVSIYVDKSLDQSQLPTASIMIKPRQEVNRKQDHNWIFGDEIPTFRLNLDTAQISEDDHGQDSVIYRKTTLSHPGGDELDQIVSTTRRRKGKKAPASQHTTEGAEGATEGFFEDDCDVLDFATDRV